LPSYGHTIVAVGPENNRPNERAPMVSTLSSAMPVLPANLRLADRPALDVKTTQSDFSNDPPLTKRSFFRRAVRALVRYLIAVGIGIGGTLAWQAYGEDAKQMVANWTGQRGWPVTWLSNGEAAKPGPASGAAMAPPSQAVAQSAPADTAVVAPIASETMARMERLEAISADLSAMRERIEQMAAGQEQMASDIAKLKTAEQEIRQKISTAAPRPAAVLPSKPRPPSPPALPQPMPLH
jgi:hypothetical protein